MLAQDKPYLEAGAFLGDYVKGRLHGEFHHEIEDGIRLHRKIDAFTDQHSAVRKCCDRFDPEVRRYAPIMLDIFFDHLLAKNWQRFHKEPLEDFSERVFANLDACRDLLPEKVAETADRMRKHDVLNSYADETFMLPVLSSLSRRLKRRNPVADGFHQFQRNEVKIREDFESFFPEVMDFATRTANSLGQK
jgi:acyl carrier protein phosphodiesterase